MIQQLPHLDKWGHQAGQERGTSGGTSEAEAQAGARTGDWHKRGHERGHKRRHKRGHKRGHNFPGQLTGLSFKSNVPPWAHVLAGRCAIQNPLLRLLVGLLTHQWHRVCRQAGARAPHGLEHLRCCGTCDIRRIQALGQGFSFRPKLVKSHSALRRS